MTGTLVQGGGLATAAGKEDPIARCEAALRAGDPEVEGLCLGLADWSAELRILQRPICIDLFSGLGGWSEGFIAEGYICIGFDNHRHEYGDQKYPGQLVIQDVLTLHGSQFKDAAVIVASPPCQNYSYLAMPWSRSPDLLECKACGGKGKYPKIAEAIGAEEIQCFACGGRGTVPNNNSKAAKALRLKWETEGPDNRLFDACFRIQREAIEARCGELGCCDWEFLPRAERTPDRACAQCFIPLIVENVRGAIPWVGRSAWNYGSFHLWGDVPALMPINLKRGMKVPGFRFDGSGKSFQTASVEATGVKGTEGIPGGDAPGTTGKRSWFFGTRADPRDVRLNENGEAVTPDGTKIGGDWFSDPKSTCRKHGSRSQARKAASAQIAKIPLPLSSHIAQVYKPKISGASRAESGAAGERL